MYIFFVFEQVSKNPYVSIKGKLVGQVRRVIEKFTIVLSTPVKLIGTKRCYCSGLQRRFSDKIVGMLSLQTQLI